MAWRGAVGLLVLLALFTLGFTFYDRGGRSCYVGVPDGAAGLLVRYVADQKTGGDAFRTVRFEPYTLYDCCASAAGYAMGSGRLDLAVMCPEAARALVAKDDRYDIAGPVIANGDVLITRRQKPKGVLEIAVSQKRRFQHQIVQRNLGLRARPVPMLHMAVPFAFARGVVQGAVVDITKASSLGGCLIPQPCQVKQPLVTAVLVVKKAQRGKAAFDRFMRRYARAVQEMQTRDNLLFLLKTYVSKDATMGEVEIWQKMNVHFTYPSNNLLPEGPVSEAGSI